MKAGKERRGSGGGLPNVKQAVVEGKRKAFAEKLWLDAGGEQAASPDAAGIVLACGGDGSVLKARQAHEGKPLFCVRKSSACESCSFNNKTLSKPVQCVYAKNPFYCHASAKPCFQRFFAGRFALRKEPLARATLPDGRTFKGLNEIQVRSSTHLHAARFSVFVDGKAVAERVIGDGVVAATPYGAGAYYKAVGGKHFKNGLGLAFNNCMQRLRNRVLKPSSVVAVKAERNCVVLADNDDEVFHLAAGERVSIKLSGFAEFVELR